MIEVINIQIKHNKLQQAFYAIHTFYSIGLGMGSERVNEMEAQKLKLVRQYRRHKTVRFNPGYGLQAWKTKHFFSKTF